MKYNVQLGITVAIISAMVSSAALKPLSRSADKLNQLDKQGYEVISDAIEEILTPMSPNDGEVSGVNLSPGIISKPEMLLYGRFYVLRKKGLVMDAGIANRFLKTENFLVKSYPSSAQQYFEYRSGPTTLSSSDQSELLQTSTTTPKINFLFHNIPSTSGGVEKRKNATSQIDTIFFPGDVESSNTTSKKYLRTQRKDRTRDESKPLFPSSQDKLRQSRERSQSDKKPEFSTRSPSTSEMPSPEPESNNDNTFDDMNSEEFVTWAKENLNIPQISNLLENHEEIDHTRTSTPNPGEGSSGDIQYNSFILVPGLKCPEGERMTHRGVCAPKYIHFTTPPPHPHQAKIRQRTNRGNAKKKLFQLLQVLQKMEAEVKGALEESASDATTTIISESEPTTILPDTNS